MKLTTLLLVIACFAAASCNNNAAVTNTAKDSTAIAQLLDSFNIAAAKANYNQYFSYFAENAVFMGTDATEHWDKKSFMQWAKPFFDRGRAWNFTALQRHIYFNNNGDLAWFDELLQTQMKICRGSGVLTKENGSWKIEQYVLSATIPNRIIDSVTSLKAVEEDSIINRLRKP